MYRFDIVANEHRKHPNAVIHLPKRATKNACAYDFFSPINVSVASGETYMLWTDVKALIPANSALLLNVRSSMGKRLIRFANTQGWVDSDYANNPSNDGNIGLLIHNAGDQTFDIKQGDRIAQGMLIRYELMDDDTAADERVGGFGSTGTGEL